MRRLVLATAVAGVALLLMAIAFPKQRVSQTAAVGEFSGLRGWPKAAAYDAGFIVTWEDGRFGDVLGRAYFSRVTTAGATLDPQGIALSDVERFQSYPNVACIGSQCLFAWCQYDQGVYLRAYNAATGVLGPITPSIASFGNYASEQPAIATDGTRFLVVYPTQNETHGRFVAADGTPISDVTLSTRLFYPSVAFGGGRYFVVVAEESGNMFARTFDTNGANPSPERNVGTVTGVNRGPSVVSYPGGFLVTWDDTSRRLSMRRYDFAGAAIDATVQRPLSGTTPRDDPWTSFDGQGFATVWFNDSMGPLTGARFSTSNLSVITPERQLLPSMPWPFWPDLARVSGFNGTSALVSWNYTEFLTPSKMGASFLNSIDGGLSVDPVVALPAQQIGDSHLRPRAAPLDDGFFVGWGSQQNDAYRGQGRRLDSTGAPLGGPAATAIGGTPQSAEIDVASDGTHTWAAWTENGEVKVARLDSAGVPGTAITVATGGVILLQPKIAFLNGRMLVAYVIAPLNNSASVYLQFVEPDGGTTFDGGLGIYNGVGWGAWNISLTASSTSYGLAWRDNYSISFFTRIDATGVALDAPGIAVDGTQTEFVSVASDGTNFMTAAAARTFPGGEVHVVPFSAAGVKGAETIINSGRLGGYSNPASPDIIFDGTEYLVAWSESVADGGGQDIYQRQVFRDGGLGPVDEVAGGAGDQLYPSLARGSQGQTLTVWLEPDLSANALRVASRVSVRDDAGFDAGTDGGLDAGIDAGLTVDAGTDAGQGDAGNDSGFPLDAGADAGPSDSGLSDAGQGDAGSTDAGTLDAGATDAGSADAGQSDAGTVDSGALDAGTDAGPASTDAGADAGETADAGQTAPLFVGCGCQSSDSSGLLLLAGLWALTLLRRRS